MTSSLNKGGPPRRSKPPQGKSKGAAASSARAPSPGKPRGRRAGGAGLGGWATGRAIRAAALTGLVGLALSVGVIFGAGYLAGSHRAEPVTAAAIQDVPPPSAPSEPLPVQARRFERAIAALPYEEPPPDIFVPGMAEAPDAEVAAILDEMAASAPDADATANSSPNTTLSARFDQPDTPISESVPTVVDAGVAPPETANPVTPPDPPPWLAYAVPGPAGPSDRVADIAIVIDDMGLDQPRSRRALDLPGPLTFALLPYGYHLRDLAGAARARGHEILVHLPMEPTGPGIDPGPNALVTTLGPEEIRARMDWAFAQFGGYVGFNNHMGSRFTAWGQGMQVVMDVARERGLLYLDSVTTVDSVAAGLAAARAVPFVARDVFLDHDQAPEAIAAQLVRVEAMARERGQAIAIGHPHDTTLAALSAWLPTLAEKGFRLVPVSAIARRRAGPDTGGQG